MIGPLNCFDSWIHEYQFCFGKPCQNMFDARCNFGSTTDKNNNLLARYKSYEMLLFNYDSLKIYSETLRNYLVPDSLLVFDESHYIKGADTQRSQLSLFISEKASRVVIMTGTPIPNSYLDLYNPLHVLFPYEYDSYFGYTTGMLSNPSGVEIEQINTKLQPFFCRTSKEDLNMPNVNPDLSYNLLASELENRLYEELIKRYSNSRLTLIIRILQMESDSRSLLLDSTDAAVYFQEDSGTVDDYGENAGTLDLSPTLDDLEGLINSIGTSTKTKRCIELIKRLVDEGKSVIVWCIFSNSITNISSILNSLGVKNRTIYGKTPISERTGILEDFNNKGFPVLVTNPHTLAESVSLHRICHDAVYFEYSYNLVHLLQSKDRIHRLGLPDGQYTQYHFMKLDYISKQDGLVVSLDEQIYQRLVEKEEIMKEAIESGKLERSYSVDEDIDCIFRKMGWNL